MRTFVFSAYFCCVMSDTGWVCLQFWGLLALALLSNISFHVVSLILGLLYVQLK